MLAGGGVRLLSLLLSRAQNGRTLVAGALPPELFGREAEPPEPERGLKQPSTPSPADSRSMVRTNRTALALDGPNPGFPTIGTTEPRASDGDSRNGVRRL